MGTLLIDKDELLAHATDDQNTLTEISGAVMQKNLWSDEAGASLDAAHLQECAKRFAEGGTLSEANNKWTYTGAAVKEKSIETLQTFNDGTIETEILTTTVNGYILVYIFKDANNFASMFYYGSGATRRICSRIVTGGVTRYDTFAATGGATNFKFKITRSGNDFSSWYDLCGGAGWVQQANAETWAIGADCTFVWGIYLGITSELNYFRASGTGVYWDTKADASAIKDTYNEQDVGAGNTIEFGSATFTQGSNMKYDYKIGSAAWQLAKTSAEIIALGDQVTDDGKFNLRAVYQGSTAQASWTSLSVPWASGVNKTGPFGNLNRLQRHIA